MKGRTLAIIAWVQYRLHNHSGGSRGAVVPGRVELTAMMWWTGPLSTIPTGYERVTGIDGRLVRGAGGAVAAGSTGGVASINLAHPHGVGSLATPFDGAHQHAVAFGASTWNYTDAGDAGGPQNQPVPSHNHHPPGSPAQFTNANPPHQHALSGTLGSAGPSTVSTIPKSRRFYLIRRIA